MDTINVKSGQIWTNRTTAEKVAVVAVRKFTASTRRGYRYLPDDAKEVMYCAEADLGKPRYEASVSDTYSFTDHFSLVS